MTQLIFKEEHHLYQTVGDESVKWTSVTSLIERYGNPFDDVAMAEKVAGKKKYRKLDAEEVLDLWHRENKRSTEMGTKFHAVKENELYEDKTLELPIFRCQSDNEGNKLSGSPVLEEGYYPELLIFFESAKICGQSDLVCIKDNKVHILDYKTNKRLDFNSFNDYKKGRLMMFPPVNNLEDCNFNHYQLQLSMYMYIILQQNPKLSPGSLIIDHYQFEKEGDDEYDYPIYKFDSYGNPIVKEKKRYTCKYMQREVKRIIENFVENDKVI